MANPIIKLGRDFRDKAASIGSPALQNSTSRHTTAAGVDPIPHFTRYTPHDDFSIVIRQEAISKNGPNPIVVRGTLPESLQVSTQSNWDTPFADGLLGPGSKLQTLARVSGFLPIVQSMTAHFWSGSTPIDISIPLTIVAYSSKDDILDKIVNLKRMTMPSKVGSIMRAPGPELTINTDAFGAVVSSTGDVLSSVPGAFGQLIANVSQDGKENPDSNKIDNLKAKVLTAADAFDKLITVEGKISIHLGRFLYFKDVVIRSVDEQYDVVLGTDGRPLKVTVNVAATTRETPTVEDLRDMHIMDKNPRERR